MNNTLYKLEKRRIKENGKYPWFQTKASVSEFGMEVVNQKKGRRKRSITHQ